MSGIETSKTPKEKQVHVCASCMNTVIQTFNHLQEQIKTLKSENANLQNEIRALEEETAKLKKGSTSRKSR
jgi:cell division protein FtsB